MKYIIYDSGLTEVIDVIITDKPEEAERKFRLHIKGSNSKTWEYLELYKLDKKYDGIQK